MNDRTLANYIIYSSNISQQYFRKYLKLSEILASVGGLIKVAILIFTFIHKPFVHLGKFNMLINTIKYEETILNYIEKKKILKSTEKLNINFNKSIFSIKSYNSINENEENNPKNIINNNLLLLKNNDFKNLILNKFLSKQNQNVIKDINNIDNSEANFIKIKNQNYNKKLYKLDNDNLIINDIGDNERKKITDLKNKRIGKNTLFTKDRVEIRKEKLENKSVLDPEKITNLQNLQPIEEKSPDNRKLENTPNNLQIINEEKENRLKILDLKMGYSDLIKGYTCNFCCKKNNLSV